MLAQNLAWNASCANDSLSTTLVIVLAVAGILAALGIAALLFWLWRTQRIPASFDLNVFACIPELACPNVKIEVAVSELNPTAQRVMMAYLVICTLMIASGGMLFVDQLNPFLIQLDRLAENVQFSQAYDDSATRALLLSSSAKWLIPLLPIGVSMLHMASLAFCVSINGVKIFGAVREGINRATANAAATLFFEAGAVFFLLSFSLWGDFKTSLIPRPATGEDNLADERVFDFFSEGVSGVLIVQCFDALLKPLFVGCHVMCWGSLLWFALEVLAWDVEFKTERRQFAYLRSFPTMAVIIMINVFLSLALAAIIFRSGDVNIDFFYSTAASHILTVLCFCFPLNTTHSWRQSWSGWRSQPLSAVIWVFATLQAVISGFQIYWLAEKNLALAWFLTACALTSKAASHFAAKFLTAAASQIETSEEGTLVREDELRVPVAGDIMEGVTWNEQRVPLLCEEDANNHGLEEEQRMGDTVRRVPTCHLNSPLAAAIMEELEVANEAKYGMRIKWRRASLCMGALCMGLGAIK